MRKRGRSLVVPVAGILLLIVVPLFLDRFWVNLGALSFAASVGAVGLTVLFGRLGQLSLGHSFFVAVGAYAYIGLSSPRGSESVGLGVSPVLAAVGACLIAGLAGLCFSPVSGRVKGLYLGIATLPLVFLGDHVALVWQALTGGYSGRDVPALAIGGTALVGSDTELLIAGMTITPDQLLWYLTGGVLAVVLVLTGLMLRGRTGRAFAAVRASETHAQALGIPIAAMRSVGFAYAGLLAGLAGVLLALVDQRVVPSFWGLNLSLSFLVMIILGGVGSLPGAVVGAVIVTVMPPVLEQYGGSLPGISDPTTAASIAQYIYGALVIAILLIAPRGALDLWSRMRRALPIPSRSAGQHSTPEDATAAGDPGPVLDSTTQL